MAREPSALEEAVSRVGDRWTLLLVDALLAGPRRFGELLEALPGLAPNVLSRRLRVLEQEGLIVATPYSRRPPRFTYQLSAAGSELAGALRLLTQWGSDRVPPSEAPHHSACGTPAEARWYCPTCARTIDPDEASDLRYA